MNHSPELAELAKALAAAQGEFGAIPKTANNPFFKSSYADLATVIKTAGPIVAKHGLSVSQHISMTDSGHDTLTTLLLHESGQYIESTMRLHLVKDDPQGQGSATSYARRYSYMSVLVLVADEDEDGNRASEPRPQQRPVDQRPRRSTPETDAPVPASTTETADHLKALINKLSDDSTTKLLDFMTERNYGTDVDQLRPPMVTQTTKKVNELLAEDAKGAEF